MTTIYDWPTDWYGWFAQPLKYRLRSLNQVGVKPYAGGITPSGPVAQVWLADCTTRPLQGTEIQDVDSFFARLRGRSGLMRFAHPIQLMPWYDRALNPTTSYFSDGTGFDDGTGFADGYLPPNVYVATAASKGDRYLVLKGFPASIANVLRRGDHIEIKPNGIPATFPHLYKLMYGGSSDAAGQVGFAIEPGLRAGVAVGDTVSLRYAATPFHLASDDAGELDLAGGLTASVSFSLIEAVDRVP